MIVAETYEAARDAAELIEFDYDELPAVTALAMGLGGLISGSILVEFIFAYPGTGYTLYESIVTQDYTVTQAIANLMIFITAASVLLLDLLYPLIDPRITYRQNVR